MDPAILLFAVGVLMFLLTFCGCIGSLRENICLLQTVSGQGPHWETLAPSSLCLSVSRCHSYNNLLFSSVPPYSEGLCCPLLTIEFSPSDPAQGGHPGGSGLYSMGDIWEKYLVAP